MDARSFCLGPNSVDEEDQRPWHPVLPDVLSETQLGRNGVRLMRGMKKERAMQAKLGDWLVIKGPGTEQADHRGLITEVRSSDGSPPYVVRWLDTGRVAMVFPGTDAVVITDDEQQAADERTQSRVAAVQAAIAHQTVSA